ncbi:MucBP domain-containing protein [Enterococcus hulanensis]|uniref:MucBP domain-containing protein n=1 Tax=Enterococcus hulanensis TaxID=2559929 RepID=UPI0010F5C441|nr:MucBP domain-containing protein [Enterococcus hulanensis]
MMKKVKLFVFLVLSLCFSVLVVFGEEAHAADMYRLYNPNSGEHFYTATAGEKNHLVKVGWKYEGIGWIAPSSGNAVYRLYNPNAGDHHYTMNAGEKNNLVKVGWKYEGIGWYSDVKKAVPLYRAYNPNAKAGSHNYTVNYAEQKNLLRVGWRDEGIAWYGINKSTPVTKYSVTVKHVGSDGKELKKSTASVEKGKSYTAKAESFSGYTLKGSSSQTVTVNGNKTITFNYTKNAAPVTKHTVTVKYVDSSGKEIEKAVTASVEKGKTYKATAKSINGYTLKGNDSQTVTVDGNKTITFTYTKNVAPVTKYTVTVKYVDSSGKEIEKAVTASVEKGKTYKATAKSISGYTLKGNDSQTVTVDGNKTITFTYTKNATPVTKYTVTIKHIGSDGKELKKATVTVEKGKPYTAKAETFTGYTLNDKDVQTISAVNADQTLTFNYNLNKYNVTVVHKGSNGKTLETEKAVSVEYGKEHTAKSKTFTGYTLSGSSSQKVTVKGATTITFTYNPNKYNVTVVHKGSDGKTLETEKAVSVEYDKEHIAKSKTFAGYTLSGNTTQTVTIKGTTTITFNYLKKYEVIVIHKGNDGKILKSEPAVDIEQGIVFSATASNFNGYTLSGESIQRVTVKGPTTITFTYNLNKYNVTVVHKSNDGTILQTEPAVVVEYGKEYTAQSKTFTGYTLSGSKTQTVKITGNQTITFTYAKNVVKYKVTVNHNGNDGKKLLTEPAVEVEQGKPYTANSKTFDGYKLNGSSKQTVTVNQDMTITFNYNSLAFDRITLHAVVNGVIVKSVTFDVKIGEKFVPSSDKLKLSPDEYDLLYTTYWPEITAVGGSERSYKFDIKPFRNYLSESELMIMQQTIVQKVNDLRKSLGVSPLQENTKLTAAAYVRSTELKQRLAHIRPDGRDISTAITEQGLSIVGYPGENIAYDGRPASLVSGKAAGEAMFESWKNSPGHYANMIDADYKYIGVGVYCYGSQLYGAQLFVEAFR